MASEEDRLDQLLNAARKQLGEPVEEDVPEEDTAGPGESMPSFREMAREAELSEPAAPVIPAPADPNAKMSDDDIAALFAAMGNNDAPAAEPEPEPAAPEIPEPADPNAKMSEDDIAALFAAMGNDDASAAEPEPEAPEIPEPADPNAKMSEDDIAALFAAMGNDDAPAAEPEPEAEAAPEIPEPADPNAKMSEDDIAALFAAMENDDAPADEGGAGDSVSQPMEDGSPKSMSQAEIEAMIAANGGGDMIIGGGNLDMKDDNSGADGADIDGPGLEDIEAQLAAAEAAGLEDDGIKLDSDADFDQIMANLGEDDIDLSDIGDIMEKSDSGELVDPSIAEDKGEETPGAGEEEAEEEGGKKKKKRVKKKREKKVKEPKEGAEGSEKKEKKPGLFSKLIAALFTEEEDDETVLIPEADATKLSDENAAILSEIDAEDKKSKPKKEKKKKEKKPKEEKPKKEKKPRPKKEKKPEEPDNSKRIPKKYIARTVFLAASIMVALLIVGTILPGLMNMRDARKAYYEKDYKTAFLTMYGKDLNESDKTIYQRSRLLVMLDRKYESYEHYMNMGMEKDALDALLQGLARYEDLLPQIQAMEVEQEALGIRLKMVDALSSVFGMSELEAMETLQYSAADYTGKIDAVIAGNPYTPMKEAIFEEYGIMLQEQQEVQPDEEGGDVLPDLLPEEQQYLEQIQNTGDEPVELPADAPAEVLYFQDGNVNIQIESDQF